MPHRIALTRLAHDYWKSWLHPGARVVDATAGNGQDTEYLAASAGPEGVVFAIDIQKTALESTSRRLSGTGFEDRVRLIQGDHAHLARLLPTDVRGQIDLICFNLGYLPHGDHAVTTRAETTLPALKDALALLKADGALSVVAYRGHPDGSREAQAVEHFIESLEAPWILLRRKETGSAANPGPVWWMLGQADGIQPR